MRPALLSACALSLLLAALTGAAPADAPAPDPVVEPPATRLDFDASRFDPPPAPAELPISAGADGLTLMFTGDTKLCGRTLQQIQRHGRGYPFGAVREVLRGADLAFGNCETALTRQRVHTAGKNAASVAAGRDFVFKSDPELSVELLTDAGFDVLQLANNHAMDYGPAGLADTLACLDAAGITRVGAGLTYGEARAPIVVEAGDSRIGWLAYSLMVPRQSAAGTASAGLNTLGADYAAMLRRDLAELDGCALRIACFHWGVEGATVPTDLQRRIGRAAVDAGADLVIGTHTHTLQGVEFYRDGVIAYSLGNFVFTGASRLLPGGVLRVTAGPQLQVALLPCWIRDGRPEPSTERRLLERIAGVMAAMGTTAALDADGWLLLQPK